MKKLMLLLMLFVQFAHAKDYMILIDVPGITPPKIGDIAFSASKTEFNATENITLTWNVKGEPTEVSISGVGVVAKAGTLTYKPGAVDSIVLTAKLGSQSATSVINTSALFEANYTPNSCNSYGTTVFHALRVCDKLFSGSPSTINAPNGLWARMEINNATNKGSKIYALKHYFNAAYTAYGFGYNGTAKAKYIDLYRLNNDGTTTFVQTWQNSYTNINSDVLYLTTPINVVNGDKFVIGLRQTMGNTHTFIVQDEVTILLKKNF